MPQDVVTARDVAAPTAAGTLQFHDALQICDALNRALTDENYRRAGYSEQSRSLFQLAWAVASHKHSTQATVYHLAYALVCRDPEAGKAMAESLKCDAGSFAVGCVLRILNLGVSTGDAAIVPPAVDAVRWVGSAAALAQMRGRQAELQPEDLVQAVLGDTIPSSVRAHLRAAALRGRAHGDAVLGERQVTAAPSTASEIIEQFEKVERGRLAAGPSDDVTNLIELIEQLDQRHAAEVYQQNRLLDHIKSLVETRPTGIEQHVLPVDDVMTKLNTIERRVNSLEEALPRPPSGAWLAAAIVTVMLLGGAAGLILAELQSVSRLGPPVSASLR